MATDYEDQKAVGSKAKTASVKKPAMGKGKPTTGKPMVMIAIGTHKPGKGGMKAKGKGKGGF
jgi:hypothetical protein